MRHEHFRMDDDEARALFAAARTFHLAATHPDGSPVARTLNGVVLDGHLIFHGSPVGEKAELVGRPAVVAVDEVVAFLPSTFTSNERACSATSFYRSAQARGVIEALDDPSDRARALGALMAHHQPEGGYLPLDPELPLYRGMLAATQVWRVSLAQIEGKAKLGQNRSPEAVARIVEGLWRRGAPGDLRAIELVTLANPDMPLPPFLTAPPGLRMVPALGPEDARLVAPMLMREYWHHESTPDRIRAALLGSAAWVGIRDHARRLVAMARALTDGARNAWIYDVYVAPEWRGQGLGKRVVGFLLDHPQVRDVLYVRLGTRDAHGLYEQLGFKHVADLPPKPYASSEMLLRREAP